MKRNYKLAAICAVFVLSVSICASAGSTDNFSGPLIGASGTESGQFTFNSTTDSFSGITLPVVRLEMSTRQTVVDKESVRTAFADTFGRH